MPGPRDYTAATRAALAILSAGECYFPGCTTPLLRFVDDGSKGLSSEPIIDYEIAHIRDANPGNRYVAAMDDNERRAFANLILLCPAHHKWIDKSHPDQYSIEDLESWKEAREGQRASDLLALGTVDQVQLDSLLIGAERQTLHAEAMAELAAADPSELPLLTRRLGTAVASLPLFSERAVIDFLRGIRELDWVRPDLVLVQESLLFRTVTLGAVLERFEPVLKAFDEATSVARGYHNAGSFRASLSLQRALEDEELVEGFVSEIRTRLRLLIRDRTVAQTLLPTLRGNFSSALAWETAPFDSRFESRWALPDRYARVEEPKQFEIFTPRTFHFRAWLTTTTIDLYGVRQGYFPVPSSELSIELIDPMAWWMVLVPNAASAIVRHAHIAQSNGRGYGHILDLVATLSSPEGFRVGLA